MLETAISCRQDKYNIFHRLLKPRCATVRNIKVWKCCSCSTTFRWQSYQLHD